VIFVLVVISVKKGVLSLKGVPLVPIKMRKAKTVARNVQLVFTAMPTPLHISAMSVQKDTTVLRGHRDLTTNLVSQALTIPKSKGIHLLTVWLVIRVPIVLIMEMKNLLIHAVPDFFVLVVTKKLNLSQHVVRLATTVLKAHTI